MSFVTPRPCVQPMREQQYSLQIMMIISFDDMYRDKTLDTNPGWRDEERLNDLHPPRWDLSTHDLYDSYDPYDPYDLCDL